MEASYVWEANKKTRFYKYKKLEGLVLRNCGCKTSDKNWKIEIGWI